MSLRQYIWHCISTNISNITLQILFAPSADIVRQGHPHGSRGLLPCNECYGLQHTQQHFSCHIFYVTFPMFTFPCHMNTLDITKGFLANVFSMRKKPHIVLHMTVNRPLGVRAGICQGLQKLFLILISCSCIDRCENKFSVKRGQLPYEGPPKVGYMPQHTLTY